MQRILRTLLLLANAVSSSESPSGFVQRSLQEPLDIKRNWLGESELSPLHPLAEEPYGESALLRLHRELVNISSISGNEGDVGNYLVEYLQNLNLTVDKQPVSPLDSSSDTFKRFNLHAYLGSTPKTRVLLTSHIDVVPPWYPYERRNNGKEIWGRGSVDAKACVAAQVQALMELYNAAAINEGDVGLLFVVGEERGGDGMKTANDLGLEWETVVFGEPTEGNLVSGHKGTMQFKLHVRGAAAHSGYPWLGRSANEIMIAGLAALEGLAHRGDLPSSAKYGTTTVNVGQINGGVAGNVVPEEATAVISLRLAASTPDDVRFICFKAMMDAMTETMEGSEGPPAEIEFKNDNEGYGPVDIDSDIEGFEVITVNYGTDIPNLEGKHKRYLYGPGSILVAHSDHEHLKVSELEKAVKDYKHILKTVLDR